MTRDHAALTKVEREVETKLAELDTDRSGEVDLPEWEAAIESALKNKLEAKKKAREAAAAAAQREIAEFTAHFMEAAQRCFELIDKDDSGTLTKEEIVVAVKSDKEVIDFLKTPRVGTEISGSGAGQPAVAPCAQAIAALRTGQHRCTPKKGLYQRAWRKGVDRCQT